MTLRTYWRWALTRMGVWLGGWLTAALIVGVGLRPVFDRMIVGGEPLTGPVVQYGLPLLFLGVLIGMAWHILPRASDVDEQDDGPS